MPSHTRHRYSRQLVVLVPVIKIKACLKLKCAFTLSFSLCAPSPRSPRSHGSAGALSETLGRSSTLWAALACSGKLWNALGCFGMLWDALGGSGTLWDALGRFRVKRWGQANKPC